MSKWFSRPFFSEWLLAIIACCRLLMTALKQYIYFDFKSCCKSNQIKSNLSNVVYHGECSCGHTYVGETLRNSEVWKVEHRKPTHYSGPAQHLANNPMHTFTWKRVYFGKSTLKPKLTEGLIGRELPTLNKLYYLQGLLNEQNQPYNNKVHNFYTQKILSIGENVQCFKVKIKSAFLFNSL